jgi:hypothetical protein
MAAAELGTEETARADTGKLARELLAKAMALLEEVTKAIEPVASRQILRER